MNTAENTTEVVAPKPSLIKSRAEKFAARSKSKPWFKRYERKDAPSVNGARLMYSTSTSKAFPEPTCRYAEAANGS